jgi:TonB family protein
MTAIASAVTTALIDFAWQGVLVACLLWITLLVLRNRPAHARYLASCMALVAMTAIPIITACLAFHPVVVGSAVSGITTSAALPAMTGMSLGLVSRIRIWALPAWSLGVLVFSCRLIRGYWQLSLFKRRATPVPEAVRNMVDDLTIRMGLTRTVRALMTTLAEVPSVAGVVRPVILLPVSSITGLSAQQLEIILAHELAHIRRLDPLVNALQILIETMLFYHPAVWWTSARIRHERELCCDDLALNCCGNALCYARALSTLEKLRALPAVPAIGSAGGLLLYRIRRILGECPRDYSAPRLSGILAVALAIGCLAVNIGTRVRAQDLPKSPSTIFESPGVRVEGADAIVVEPIFYPRPAAEKGIQGTVVMQADVDTQGNITDARVLSGPPELRKAALQPVLTWRFKSDGRASTRQISVAFQVPPLQELDSRETRRKAAAATEEMEVSRRAQLEQIELSLQALERERQEMLRRQTEQRALLEDQVVKRQREEITAALQAQASELQRRRSAAGRILVRIEVSGLSEERRAQLGSQFPVKLGDTVSLEAMEAISRVIHEFDKELKFELVPLDNNEAILRIGGANTYWADERSKELVSQLNNQMRDAELQLAMARRFLSERHPDVINMKARLMALRQQHEDLLREEALRDRDRARQEQAR